MKEARHKRTRTVGFYSRGTSRRDGQERAGGGAGGGEDGKLPSLWEDERSWR